MKNFPYQRRRHHLAARGQRLRVSWKDCSYPAASTSRATSASSNWRSEASSSRSRRVPPGRHHAAGPKESVRRPQLPHSSVWPVIPLSAK
jgi:hypothetical protein